MTLHAVTVARFCATLTIVSGLIVFLGPIAVIIFDIDDVPPTIIGGTLGICLAFSIATAALVLFGWRKP